MDGEVAADVGPVPEDMHIKIRHLHPDRFVEAAPGDLS